MRLKDEIKARELLVVLVLNVRIDQLAMASSVCWYGHVMSHILRKTEFWVYCQKKKRRHNSTWKRHVMEET